MATFDLGTFLKVQGKTGVGALPALGMAFGLPSCLLNLASDALNILPSSVLANMQSEIMAGKSKANNVTKEVFKKLMLNTGIIEFDTQQGLIKFKSNTAWQGTENNIKQSLQNLGGLLGAFQYAASFGAQLYQNYTDIKNQIDAIGDCLDKFKELQSFQSGNSADQAAALSPEDADELFNTVYAADKVKLKNSSDFIKNCNKQISAINNILRQRELDPSLEPRFLDSGEFDQFLDDTTFDRGPLEDPGLKEEVFRLTYGPPISQNGQYVLTSDGLYYDSQSGGLDPVFLAISGIVPPGDAWKYDYDPNLGGKGTSVSIKSLNKFSDNMFDIEKVDDSAGLQHFYDEDHFLEVLLSQRNKFVYDLSAQLDTYIGTYGADSSIVHNQRQLIISEVANHNSKVNRRKKQIEVAIKAPQVYGGLAAPLFSPGDIPINDFSFLDEYNLEVDLEKQKALIFSQADVLGLVLPLEVKFAKSSPKPESITFEHLHVPTVGKGSIIYTPSGLQSGSVLSLTDQIISKDLFAIYNFLDSDISLPSSIDFETTNCATPNMYNNAQLVSTNTNQVFFSGLGIPYFEGIVKNKSSDTKAASALGSYLKLPDTKEYKDLTYSPSGFTMECWVHVPNITDGGVGWLSATTSSLTKVLLSSENVGNKEGYSPLDHTGTLRDLDLLENLKGDEFVRGMICGFTRDRRITQASAGYSNDNAANAPASSLSFFIAPTQSRDLSSCSWINNDDCQDYETFYKMKVDLSATDFGNVSSQFVLIDITVNPVVDEISFFADGQLVTTSSISASFGVDKHIAPMLPNFKKENSFEYSSSSVDAPTTLHGGPKLNPFYTPWIVGGGYTDGMYKYGNFMGGDRGGLVSGLRGHLGSLKFYARPLNNNEVLTNYKAQEGFFKTIIT